MRRAWKSSKFEHDEHSSQVPSARRPHLEVVALGGGEAEVAAAEQHDAVRQLERLEDGGDVARQLLVLVVAGLGRRRT